MIFYERCSGCGHEMLMHDVESGVMIGVCEEAGCDCEGYVSPDDDDFEDEDPA